MKNKNVSRAVQVISLMMLTTLIMARPSLRGQDSVDLAAVKSTLTEEIEKLREDYGIPSVSLALFQENEIIWAEAFGFSNAKLKVPATPDTIYSTGSTFKTATAMAVMKLVEEGKLKLDDPINSRLGTHAVENFSDEKPATIRHLLSHYSGLTPLHETQPLWERKLPRTLEELATDMRAEEAPGTNFEYSNAGYALAGLIVQEVSGQTYEQYVVDNFLRPVGEGAFRPVNPTPAMFEELAFPYRLESRQAVPVALVRHDVYPAGDTYLTPTVMAMILSTHLTDGKYFGEAILSEASISEMRTPPFENAYALGMLTRDLDGERFLIHAGGVPGFSTIYFLGLDSKVGVYIASNAGGVNFPMRIIAQLSMDLLRGKEIGKGIIQKIAGIGIGLAVDERTGVITISDVLPNSPAEKAGLSANLVIESINEVEVEGKSLEECFQIMEGPVGTTIQLKLVNSRNLESRTAELTKQSMLIPS